MYRSTSARRPADFIVLSAMRSGSNNLQDTLNAHPEIECGGEVFNPRHLQIRGRVYQQDRPGNWAHVTAVKAAVAAASYGKRWCPALMLRMARRPRSKGIFGFRLFGDHIACFRLSSFLEELNARGTRFIHLVRRDTFDQALSLVRAQVTGVWKVTADTLPALPAPDLLALADRVRRAAELLHGHKVIAAGIARRYGALLLDYDEYTRDERSYDRVQDFLEVRSRATVRHANAKTPPVDGETYHRLREEVERGNVPMRFDPEAM
jgi:LPS sulfotransferase NodH